jgi:UDP-N-acetyl-alpha-D-muramoyl-L-alanyl-L-glutamate epimerase
MIRSPAPADRFRYDGFELDPEARRLVCRYSLGSRRFSEEIGFGDETQGGAAEGGGWSSPAADAAARIVYLLAGVSYFKTAAPPLVDLGEIETTDDERRFLRTFYVEGLAEFAYRNRLDLSGLRVEGPPAAGPAAGRVPVASAAGRPLVPFGGGIDSIVTVEALRRRLPGASLFIVSRTGDRFAAIEQAAATTGLPIVRADRRIDPAVLRSEELGFLNGHVPVTGIVSAIAVLAAVAGGYDAVIMSNERSASASTVEAGGRSVNHQWSKSLAFETAFRGLMASTFEPGIEYFSYLRARSELWVAERFAALPTYHAVFRSCNRAFHIEPARRYDRWCGTCDKCCFIDLVLSPFLDAGALSAIFDGREPLADPALAPKFRALLGIGAGVKPFECVGDEVECRAAAVLAAARPDRARFHLLHDLAAEATAADAARGGTASLGVLLAPQGPDFVPAALSGDGVAIDAAAGDGVAVDAAARP